MNQSPDVVKDAELPAGDESQRPAPLTGSVKTPLNPGLLDICKQAPARSTVIVRNEGEAKQVREYIRAADKQLIIKVKPGAPAVKWRNRS